MIGASKRGVVCRWYLADEVRMELGGKVTVIGLYPDDTVIIEMPPGEANPTPQQPIAIEGLTVLCTLRGFEGKHEFELTLVGADPARTVVRQITMETNSVEASLNLVSRFRPLFIESFGQKLFRLESKSLGFVSDFAFTLGRRDLGEQITKTAQIHLGKVRTERAPEDLVPSEPPTKPAAKRSRKKA